MQAHDLVNSTGLCKVISLYQHCRKAPITAWFTSRKCSVFPNVWNVFCNETRHIWFVHWKTSWCSSLNYCDQHGLFIVWQYGWSSSGSLVICQMYGISSMWNTKGKSSLVTWHYTSSHLISSLLQPVTAILLTLRVSSRHAKIFYCHFGRQIQFRL